MTATPSGNRRGKCPICSRPSVPDYRPFCSRRCADVDLGRWLSGAYVIPDREKGEDRAPGGKTGEETGSDRSRDVGQAPRDGLRDESPRSRRGV